MISCWRCEIVLLVKNSTHGGDYRELPKKDKYVGALIPENADLGMTRSRNKLYCALEEFISTETTGCFTVLLQDVHSAWQASDLHR